jgi:hypothetical protein
MHPPRLHFASAVVPLWKVIVGLAPTPDRARKGPVFSLAAFVPIVAS